MPRPLSDTGRPPLLKLKIRGNVELRPILCPLEPEGEEEEFCFLVGAIEVNWELVPINALDTAEANRTELLNDSTRKTLHTRLTKK